MDSNKTEQEALNTLIGKGIPVKIGDVQYEIKEPTLAVLDQMSLVWLTFPEVDERWSIQEAVEHGRKLTHDHARSMAKVVSMAILGERMFIPLIGRLMLRRLTSKVMHSCRPSDIKSMVEVVTATNGLVNFIISMRLMSTATTTKKKTPIE